VAGQAWAAVAGSGGGGGGGGGGGTYFEAGAADGVTASNTLLFHRCAGWRGVLVEPSMPQATVLRETRPADHVLAVAPSCGTHTSIEFGVERSLGSSLFEPFRRPTAPTHCGPLREYLAGLGVDHIDLLSLDVEGSEESVLSTIDWAALRVDALVTESQSRLVDQRPELLAAVRALLAREGFVLLRDAVTRNDLWLGADFAAAECRRRAAGGGGKRGLAMLREALAEVARDPMRGVPARLLPFGALSAAQAHDVSIVHAEMFVPAIERLDAAFEEHCSGVEAGA